MLYVFLFIVVGVGIAIVARKASQNKQARKEQKKRDEENELKNKFKNNTVVQSFADNISQAIYFFILQDPYSNHTFHINAVETHLKFGVALQHILNTKIDEFFPRPNRQVIREYNFAASQLPDLKDEEQRTLFSMAVAEIVQTKLMDFDEKLPISISVIANVVHDDEEETFAFGKMSAITYMHPQVQGDW